MSLNPLALAVVAAIRMGRAGKSEMRRFEYGREMVRILKSRGYTADVRMSVAQFIEGVAALSAAHLVEEFMKEIDELYKEDEVMPISTPIVEKVLQRKSFEWGLQEGMQKGIKEGKEATARLMLGRNMKIDVIADLTGLTEDEVRAFEKQN
jgi:predicted transposase/invertase (TIGR01784 family)